LCRGTSFLLKGGRNKKVVSLMGIFCRPDAGGENRGGVRKKKNSEEIRGETACCLFYLDTGENKKKQEGKSTKKMTSYSERQNH